MVPQNFTDFQPNQCFSTFTVSRKSEINLTQQSISNKAELAIKTVINAMMFNRQ